jgi:hypothetical protein
LGRDERFWLLTSEVASELRFPDTFRTLWIDARRKAEPTLNIPVASSVVCGKNVAEMKQLKKRETGSVLASLQSAGRLRAHFFVCELLLLLCRANIAPRVSR